MGSMATAAMSDDEEEFVRTDLDEAHSRRAASTGELLVTIAVVMGPALGLVAALYSLRFHPISPSDVWSFLVMYALTIAGIGMGFHRLLTHRSYKTTKWMTALLVVFGSMALQGPVIRWVAHHRRHHAAADSTGDPHSPVADGRTLTWRSFLHAHVGWLFAGERVFARRYAPDLLDDEQIRSLDSRYALWVLLSFAMPGAVGWAASGSLHGGAFGVLWGGLVRIAVVHQVTWSINSVCHVFGSRPFAARGRSTNHPLCAVLTFGEGWHNNHHAFPSSARHGLLPGQLDTSAFLIALFERIGLAWDVKLPSKRALAAKRAIK